MQPLIEELHAARAHTRRVADDLRAGRESILPNADALYNSATVAHDDRWTLPLPSFSSTLEFRDEVLRRVLERIRAGGEPDLAYFARLAARHEDMHAEAFHYTRQTLGYPAPQLPPPGGFPGNRVSGDAELPGGRFELGAQPGPEFAFDNEKWGHPVILAPFRMSRTEAEWEYAASLDPVSRMKRRYPWGDDAWTTALANLAAGALASVHGYPRGDSAFGLRQMIGNVWEWTASTFLPYPGFVRDPYQEYSEPWFGTHKVLRGGSFATPPRVAHAAFRNFYTPDRADIFAGFRTCAL